jgi:formylglycine-generating enzyme required for sulfatase activity
MRRWFLSYNSQDLALTQAFEDALRRKDAEAQVFFAPKSLRAGGYWLKQLADEIARANAFVLLIGEKGLGRWQFDEYCEARDRRVPVVLVLLEGQPAPGLPMLRQLHWIVTAEPASEHTVARVLASTESDSTQPQELWRHTAPYRGLAAMTESDVDLFFGRNTETVEVIKALAAAQSELPILLGNSGVGKSSLAQAGVLAALVRQAWPEAVGNAYAWPQPFSDSRRWCILKLKPGTEPIRSLVEPFLRIWQFDPTDPRLETRQAEWIESLIEGRNTLKGLLNATEDRLQELGQAKPPAFLIYIDQGEELYVRAEERQRRCFSNVLAQGLGDSRLHALMSMRSDFLGELQKDEPLYHVRRQIDVPPLREAELHEVVSRPAELLAARFETAGLVDIITRRTAEDSVKDVGALPLLSYTLDDMWTQMVKRGDGVLRLAAQSFELGGVLVDRADHFLAAQPKSQDELRRIFMKLATVREGEEPTRRRAPRSEFTDGEWRLVSELAGHPNRLLVTATSETGETYAEVAHEAVFRRLGRVRDWIAAEREFLAWKTGLEAARRAWQGTPDSSKDDALLMGVALAQARSWLGKRREDLPVVDRNFIDQSTKRESKVRARARRAQALIYVLLVGIILGLIGLINRTYIEEEVNWYWTMQPYMVAQVRPYVLSPDAERALKPGQAFRECAKDCPQMVVVPAGEFVMGSPPTEKRRMPDEVPQHTVTIARPFAVSKYDVTFNDWDACVSVGGCPREGRAGDVDWGRDTRPVIYVSWDDAQQYVAWLSLMTGKPYRLLSDAEFEYAARAGTQTAYPWGNDIGKNNANCAGCGSQWSGSAGTWQTAPVGSFAANRFGLHDMVGNIWKWVQDCYHPNYNGAPTDGSTWTGGDCTARVIRGGSWGGGPEFVRPAFRDRSATNDRNYTLGFRVARTLVVP